MCIGIFLGLVGCSGTQQKFSRTWHDQGIKTAVRLQLMRDDRVQARHVRVAVRDGRVTLAGHVRTAAERQRAEQQALRASGVASVENRIAVMDRKSGATAPVSVATRAVPTTRPMSQPLTATTAAAPAPMRNSDFTENLVTNAAQEGRAAARATERVPSAPGAAAPRAPVIQPREARDVGYVDRGMLPPARTVETIHKPAPTAAASAGVSVPAASPPKAVAPKRAATPAPKAASWWQSGGAQATRPASAPAAGISADTDAALAQEAANELKRLKSGN